MGNSVRKGEREKMMKRKCSLALAAILVATGLMALPAMAEKVKPVPPSGSEPARLALTDVEKANRMKEIVDARIPTPCVQAPGDPPCPDPPIPMPARFPAELRLLTLLTLDLTLRDLFGETSASPGGSGGKSISDIVDTMKDNWRIYKVELVKADLYFKNLPFYKPTEKYLPKLTRPLLDGHLKNTPWRHLAAKDIKHKRNGSSVEPDGKNKNIFENLDLLSRNAVGGDDALPMFPFLTLGHKTPTEPDGRRGRIDALLSGALLDRIGHLTYYDLFTKTYDSPDVTPEMECAIQLLLGNTLQQDSTRLKACAGFDAPAANQLLRVRGPLENVHDWLPPVLSAASGGIDCCCQNLDSFGKKKCHGQPDLGCTNTGNPPRCTLGSVACPAGTVCP